MRDDLSLQRSFGVCEARCSYFGADFVHLGDRYGLAVVHREHGSLARFIKTLRRLRPSLLVAIGAYRAFTRASIAASIPASGIVALAMLSGADFL